MNRKPDFDELVGTDVPEAERERLRRTHDLLVQAGPPPELSPQLEHVQWPEDALAPIGIGGRRAERRRASPMRTVLALAAAALLGFLLGQTTQSNKPNSIDAQKTLGLRGTALDRDALASLALGSRNTDGNWSMLLHVTKLEQLPEGGYYDLYLTKHGRPVVLCGTFNVGSDGEAVVRFDVAYDLSHFDRNGWVVTRQIPPNHKPTDIVLRAS